MAAGGYWTVNPSSTEFALTLADAEPDPFTADCLHQLFGLDASLDRNRDLIKTSDLWAHGILLGADGGTDDTAVENVTWGPHQGQLVGIAIRPAKPDFISR